jgi:hypothetical protein
MGKVTTRSGAWTSSVLPLASFGPSDLRWDQTLRIKEARLQRGCMSQVLRPLPGAHLALT